MFAPERGLFCGWLNPLPSPLYRALLEGGQPERTSKEQSEFLGENPQQGKGHGKNEVIQDTSPTFATSGPLHIDDKKWNFIYGRATGSKHNLDRTAELKKTFDKLGFPENEASKKMLLEHFDKVAREYPIAGGIEAPKLAGGFSKVKKISQLTGASGEKATLKFLFELQSDGSLRFITIIAKVHIKNYTSK